MKSRKNFIQSFDTEPTVSYDRQLVCPAEKEHPFVYIIRDGYIKVVENRSETGKKTILVLGPGDMFPLIWAFDHPEKTAYYYESMRKADLIKFKTNDFKEKMKTDAVLNRESLLMFVDLSWDLMERVKCLQTPYTYGKLIKLLPYLIAKFGDKLENNKYQIPNFVTQEEIAQLIGTSRESVTKHFQLLREDGIIEKVKSGLNINANNKVLKEHLKDWLSHAKR